MHRHVTFVVGAATLVAALGLSGCSHRQSSSTAPAVGPAVTITSTATAVRQTAPVPPPDALADVLYRLADRAVPGTEKLSLVEGATVDNAPALDKFAVALVDGGYSPAIFDVTNVAWSDRDPTEVVANVNVTTPNRDVPGFSFPMEFKPYRGGWQLSQQTAGMLLAFGSPQAVPGPPPSPTP
ncbi:hypothetical protein [Mycobacterium botniense]|uniref:Putative lipoprotein LppK n=1 Tax=Mycobacterium botniense TaxID=84962 RepID=A0A7I9Y1S2_9MYCO|nr:hypothetical protein [Mycobacterium botniense]GFG76019.1 putative lipoprotein LppK [Mycobacterium botniense]